MDETRETELRRAIYRAFAETGRAPEPAEVGATGDELAALAERHALVLDEQGAIAFANPFSAAPRGFRVTAGERSYEGTCVWDGLGVLAALGRDGAVATSCPDCGELLELRVEDGRLRPTEAVVHFLVPAAAWYEDLVHT